MAKTTMNKNGKVTIKGLTSDEYDVLWNLLFELKEMIQEDGDEYSVGERFIYTCDKETYDVIRNMSI